MRSIVNGRDPIYSLWCSTHKKAERYRLMRYHVKTDYEGMTLLLNVVTGEMVLLSEAERILIDSLPAAYRPEMDGLITHRFLVPETFDELTSVIQLRRAVRRFEFNKDQLKAFTILPTTACNARCFYCYENNYPAYTMDERIALSLVDYIESTRGDANEVSLCWFGGEPTLGVRYIDFICDHLKERNISYVSSMISNGFLFDKEMARKAKDKWKLRNIQITLDGTEEVYNKVKSYINPGNNPYQRVLDNIRSLLEENIYVSVRMNMDLYNKDNLILLIDELSDRFAEFDRFSVYVHEIFEGMGYDPILRTWAELQSVVKQKYLIESYIESKGLKRSKYPFAKNLPHLKISFCMADNPRSVVINPEGRIGKCQHVQYSHLIGDMQNKDLIDKDELSYWLDFDFMQGCRSCTLFPACGVPQTCASGRSCIPDEVDHKLTLVKNRMIQIIQEVALLEETEVDDKGRN